jgi:hypothetical protein
MGSSLRKQTKSVGISRKSGLSLFSTFETYKEFSNRCGNSRIDADGVLVQLENASKNIKELDQNEIIYR